MFRFHILWKEDDVRQLYLVLKISCRWTHNLLTLLCRAHIYIYIYMHIQRYTHIFNVSSREIFSQKVMCSIVCTT